MNAGFSSLDVLKAFLLAEDLREQLTYDEALTRLGLGVAGAFEVACNRKFARVVGDTFVTSADRLSFVLPRYPVESIASVELRETFTDAWTAQSDVIENVNEASGLVVLSTRLATYPAQMRITYTGGFWWDVDDGASQPSGSTLLPEELRTAWLLQCEALWQAHDGLGTSPAKPERPLATLLSQVELLPGVKQTLSGYVRYALL